MNPLLSIWSQPKNTVQYMIDNKPISYLVFLAILYSFATGFLSAADQGFFEGFSLPVILLIVTIISIVISIAKLGGVVCYLYLACEVIGRNRFDSQYELRCCSWVHPNHMDDANWVYRRYYLW